MRLAAYPGENRDKLKRPEEILSPYIYLLGPDSKNVTGESFDSQWVFTLDNNYKYL